MQENQIGFSLAELLFTIVITVILVTVAFVSYQSYIKSARQREAQTMLLSNARFMERFYHQHSSFKKTSTTWPDLPDGGNEIFCIRPHGDARGALNDKFTLKAVAYDKDKEPRILKINESLITVICEGSTSICEEGKNYFSGSDKKCTVFQP